MLKLTIMKYLIKNKFYWLMGLLLMLTSCEEWLEVKMKDKILENVLYSNLEGYTTALNGIYSEMNSPQIYGEKLSMSVIDVMAQYYDVRSSVDHSMYIYGGYDYRDESYESLFYGVWSKMYSLLANINLLLENCQRADAPISGDLKNVIMGEAYALRGMLHFDLLRLYGPCYNESTKGTKVMPYMISADRSVRPLQSAEEILGYCIDDFQLALDLLRQSDPVIDHGPKNQDSMDELNNEMSYRQYRLNYYAVCALMARAQLWGGNQEEAKKYALEVVGVTEGSKAWFPFTSRSAVNSESNPDRVFSTEVLFALYNTSRKDLYTKLFSKEISVNARLTFYGDQSTGRVGPFYGDEQDVRYSLWKSELADSIVVLYNPRFQESKDPKNQYMIPLIRTSEMFLLLAECADNDTDAAAYINKIRYQRNAMNIYIQEGTRDSYIAKEFAREMMFEGQLFFYYKRKAMTSIPDGHSVNGTIEMPLTNYVWLLPQQELDNRVD